jgi:hypothetical protein
MERGRDKTASKKRDAPPNKDRAPQLKRRGMWKPRATIMSVLQRGFASVSYDIKKARARDVEGEPRDQVLGVRIMKGMTAQECNGTEIPRFPVETAKFRPYRGANGSSKSATSTSGVLGSNGCRLHAAFSSRLSIPNS